MSGNGERFLGVGIYSIPEASILTGVTTSRIRRWLRGYSYRLQHGRRGKSPPVWRGDFKPARGVYALSFADLIEIQLIAFFRGKGVPWRTIRQVEESAGREYRTNHPFLSRRFRTDGYKLFEDLGPAGKGLVDFLNRQKVFETVVGPSLLGIEFKGDRATRWWPMGQDRQVVLDPNRSFGKPIVNREGVLTHVLAGAYAATKSMDEVIDWYEVSRGSAEDAVAFERKLAA